MLFTEWFLKVMASAYGDFIERASIMGNSSYSKSDQVRETIKRADGEITKKEVLRQCGNVYEYLLSKPAAAGLNGRFRTPRHIIRMMVDLMEPGADEIICENCTASLIRAAAV